MPTLPATSELDTRSHRRRCVHGGLAGIYRLYACIGFANILLEYLDGFGQY